MFKFNTRYLIPVFAASCLMSSMPVLANKLNLQSPTEKEITAAVDAHMKQATKDLEHVVNINSGTMNFDGVKQVGMFFKAQLDELGFKTQWLDGSAFNRAGHLVAEYKGKNAQNASKLLLIGHLDTVFAKDDDFQKFEWLDKRYAAGPGTTDMKGGDVIMVTAMRALKDAGQLDKINVRIVITGDEESSGRPLSLSKQAIVDGAKWADIALGFEDGDSNVKTAVIARRGAIGWSLEVKGKPAHSSQIFQPHIGDGAIFEAARILNEFREQLKNEPNLTFNPGLLVAGTRADNKSKKSMATAFGKDNVIAKTAKITGDIRAVSQEQLAKTKRIMRKIVANNLNHTSAKITFAEGYPPMAPTDNNRKLLAVYDQISQDLGYGPVVAVDPRKAGAADISFAADHVEMALDGLGLMGDGGHTKDEVADMNTFQQNTRKATLLIYRLSK